MFGLSKQPVEKIFKTEMADTLYNLFSTKIKALQALHDISPHVLT